MTPLTSVQPLVSVVTPVYNGAEYLRACVESVLSQSYRNWEYVIVNNCSTDETLQIAQEYAAKDSRIQVLTNSQKLPMFKNWNHSMRVISPQSKYCKVLHADDWLMSDCIEKMVALAEENPSVSIVGSYRLEENRVTLDGLPYPSFAVSGKKIGRATLLGQLYVFGTPSNLLLRSDVVRERPDFYISEGLHADTETCYEILLNSDFGFVHQVLTFTRRHNEAATAFSKRVNTYLSGDMTCLVRYGHSYLSEQEYKLRFDELMHRYYGFLAESLFQDKGADFWSYHKKALADLGYPLSKGRLVRAWLPKGVRHVFHPFSTLRSISGRIGRSSGRLREETTP